MNNIIKPISKISIRSSILLFYWIVRKLTTEAPKAGSYKQRINVFLLGFGLAAVIAFASLNTSIWKSTHKMETSVAGLRVDLEKNQAQIYKRINEIENKIKKFE